MNARERLLEATGGPPDVAKRASAALMAARDNPAFMHDVIVTASDPSFPEAARKLALLTAKNSEICRTDARLVGTLQHVLPPLLEDPGVARIAAIVLAFMVVRGDPAAWYPVYLGLVDPWRTSEPVLRALAFMAEDGSAEVRLGMVGAALCAANCVAQGDVGNDTERIRHCFVIVANVLSTAGLQHSAEFADAIHRLFRAALSVGLIDFQRSADESDELLPRSFELECECVGFFIAVCRAVAAAGNADTASSVVHELTSQLLHVLANAINVYAHHVLREDADLHEGVEAYATKLLELLEDCFSNPTLAPAAFGALVSGSWAGGGAATSTEAAAIRAFVELILCYGIVSPHRWSEWQSNPNAYLQDEDNRVAAVSTHAHDTAMQCLKLVARQCPSAGELGLVVDGIGAVLFADEPPAGGEVAATLAVLGGGWWRLRESALHAADVLAARCKRELAAAGLAGMDRLAPRVVAVDVVGDASGGQGGQPHPVQQCRALAFLGTTIRKPNKYFTDLATLPGLTANLLPACCITISQAADMPLLAVAAVRLLQHVLAKAPSHVLASAGESVPAALLTFIGLPAATGDILYGALEALQAWAARCPNTAGLEDAPARVCDVWRANVVDPHAGELVVELFRSLAASMVVATPSAAACERSFLSCLPWMCDVLQGFEDPGTMFIIPSVLDIVSRILRMGTDAAAGAAFSALLGPLCQLTLTNEDSAVVSSALRCIAAVVDRAGFAVAAELSTDIIPSAIAAPGGFPPLDEAPEPAPFPDVAAAVLFAALSPERKESTLMNAGRSLYRLLALVAYVGHPRTPALVSAIVQRTATLKTDMVLQEVLFPLTRWVAEAPASAFAAFAPDDAATFLGLLLGRLHFFDGAALLASVDVAQCCIEQAEALGIAQSTVTVGAGRGATRLSVPVAAFAGLARVLVALHDGEISGADAVDLDDEAAMRDHDGNDDDDDDDDEGDWSSSSSGDEGDEGEGSSNNSSSGQPQFHAGGNGSRVSSAPGSMVQSPASRSPSMGSPQTSSAASPAVGMAPNAAAAAPSSSATAKPRLKQRIVDLLAAWVGVLGPSAAGALNAHQKQRLQKLWARQSTGSS